MLSKIFIIILSISSIIFSQAKVDSLWNEHNLSTNEETRINILNRISNYYMAVSKFDSALSLSQTVLNYAETNNIDSLKALVYSNYVLIYTEKDQHDIALEYSNKALDYAMKLDDKILQSTILGNTSIIFGKEGNFKQEVEYTKRSLKIAEELESKIDIAISLGNLATAYYSQGYHETAINYTLNSMKISKEINDSIGIGFMSMQMGDNYQAINKFDEALEYYENAIEIFNNQNAPLEKSNAQVSYGMILTEKNYFEEARHVFDEALASYNNLDLNSGKAFAESSIAELLYKQKKYIEAQKYATSAFKYIISTGINPSIFEANLLLAKINIELNKLNDSKRYLNSAEKILTELNKLSMHVDFLEQNSKYYQLVGNYNQAFKNQKLLIELKDSVQKNKNMAIVSDLQIKYDVETQQKENELLVAQNRVQQLKAEESETIRNFSIVIILILIIGGLILYNRYRAKIQLNNKLREANATKDKFFSIISHDLKNPFSTLLGYTDMLIMDYKNFSEQERKDYIGSIQKSAKHTFNLLENLLNWSRTQRGEIQIQKSNLNLNELIDKTVKLVSETAKNKKIELVKEIPSDLIIRADHETISTVIRNLVMNAIKFTNENGIVIISAVEKINEVQISVIDSGIGIAQENLDKIFRIDSHHTTQGTANEKGTGLGLVLCKEFMKQNNGTISVKSILGKGSTFTISISKN